MLATIVVQDIETEQILYVEGDIYERESPCSTFKAVLASIGFDAGILQDEVTPTWEYQEGFDAYLPSLKEPQTPTSWITNSCVWYSEVLVSQLDLQSYVEHLDYGNRDVSAPLSWISSTLQVSPKEQVDFITKLVKSELPLSQRAQELARNILLYKEEEGVRIYGKTGSDCRSLGWYVGWIEEGEQKRAFACMLRGEGVFGVDAREVMLNHLEKN